MSKRPVTKMTVGTTTQATGEGAVPEAAPPAPSAEIPPADRVAPRPEAAPRTGLTIRLLNTDGERLRTLAFQTKRTKQDLLDMAIREFLDRNGA